MGAMLTVDPEHLRGRLIHRAVETLSEGGVIIYPTDTIYGLGCDITNKSAIERIQRIKQRDAKKPMSFVCADVADISTYAHVSKFAFRILQRLLPGPFTFILPATKETPRVLRSKQKTVGVRIPDHPVSTASVIFSAHMMIGMLVLGAGTNGIDGASATRRPSTPCT